MKKIKEGSRHVMISRGGNRTEKKDVNSREREMRGNSKGDVRSVMPSI